MNDTTAQSQVAESKPPARPLNPMPIAPPELAAIWMARVTKGAFIGLVVGTTASLLSLLLVIFIPSRFDSLLGMVWFPLPSTIALISLWLITSPEPGKPFDLFCPRWIARCGVIAGLASMLLKSAVVHWSITPTDRITVASTLLPHIAWFGSFAHAWYSVSLARRIKDKLLVVICKIGLWVIGLSFVLTASSLACNWDGGYEQTASRLEAGHTMVEGTRIWISSPGWMIAFVAMFGLIFWIGWRFWNRLRTAAASLKELAEQDSAAS